MTNRMIHILETFKNSIANLLAIIFVFLTPLHGMLLTTTLFVAADLLLALFVIVKTEGWAGIKSAKLYNTIPKTVFYLSAICLGFLVDTHIVDGAIWGIELLISKIVCGFIIWIELKSLDESSQKLGNRSIWTIIREMLFRVKAIKKDLNEITKDEEDGGQDNLG